MKTKFVKSDDPMERVYNKKGYRLALLIDNSPAFKFTLKNFMLSTIPLELLEEKKLRIDYLLKLDNNLIRMFLTDFKIFQKWLG